MGIQVCHPSHTHQSRQRLNRERQHVCASPYRDAHGVSVSLCGNETFMARHIFLLENAALGTPARARERFALDGKVSLGRAASQSRARESFPSKARAFEERLGCQRRRREREPNQNGVERLICPALRSSASPRPFPRAVRFPPAPGIRRRSSVQPYKEFILCGEKHEAGESYPSSEVWGTYGFTCQDLDAAWLCFPRIQGFETLPESLRQMNIPLSLAESFARGITQPNHPPDEVAVKYSWRLYPEVDSEAVFVTPL